MSDDKISELPVRFKKPPSEEVFLTVAPYKAGRCYHGQYEVDPMRRQFVKHMEAISKFDHDLI